MQKTQVLSLGWELSWRRVWQPTPEFLPGEFHGQRSLAGHSPQGHKESDMTEQLTHTQTHIHEGVMERLVLGDNQQWQRRKFQCCCSGEYNMKGFFYKILVQGLQLWLLIFFLSLPKRLFTCHSASPGFGFLICKMRGSNWVVSKLLLGLNIYECIMNGIFYGFYRFICYEGKI